MINSALNTNISAPQMFTFPSVHTLAEFIYQKDFSAAVERTTHKDREEQLSEGKARLKNRMNKVRRK
jgi:hypothetical protein